MTSTIDRSHGVPGQGPDDATARLAAVPRRAPAVPPWPPLAGPPLQPWSPPIPHPMPQIPCPPPVVDPLWPAAGAATRLRRPRREWIWAGALGLLFLLVITVAAGSVGSTTTVRGTVTLNMNNVLSTGSSCVGAGLYSYLGTGTPVTIYDASGTIVGTTTLGTGTATRDGSEWSSGYASTCVFSFTIDDVPTGDTFYRVAAGSGSSGVTFTGDELREGGAHISVNN